MATPWPYAGALIAIGVILPNVVWQWQHNWPFLEIGEVAATSKNVALDLPHYLLSQLLLVNPVAAPVWIAGVLAPFLAVRWRNYRIFSLQYIFVIGMQVVLHGKDYYAAGLYPPLFALGAVAFEALSQSRSFRWAVASLIAASGLLISPFAVPVLPIDTVSGRLTRRGGIPEGGSG
ncbi:MAG: hypothetical protein ABR878_18305 [Roseiarcus sp.]